MDEEIAKWVLEFLLRQPIDDKIVNGVLSSIPIPDSDNRLKKTLLLRRIESETSNGSVSEKLLDWLEIIEEFDHRLGKTASDSMKRAYCAVAVDCTVRFLEENVEKNAKYFEAVERVWRGRVCKTKSLASEESKRWLGEIEAAVWDAGVCEKILMRNTRNEALKAVKGYLIEGWGSLGPTFLELVAEKFGDVVEGLRGGGGSGVGGDVGGGGDGVVGSANPCRELVAVEETQKCPAPLRRKHVAMKGKRHRAAKISDADEGHDDESMNKSKRHRGANMSEVGASMNKANAAPTTEVDRVQAAFIPSPVEQNASVRNDLSDAHQTAQALSSTRATDNINSKNVVENQTGPDLNTTAEVDRVRKALKSSSMDLHASVRDPLPDALQTAQTLSSTIATDKKSSETVVENQTRPEIHDPRESTENDTENIEKKDDPTQDAQVKENQGRRKLSILPRRSLMEPNGTSHTFEWDDSIDNLPGGSPIRPCLPSQRENKLSPLKKYEEARFTRRRMRKMWTSAEEDTLRAGVQKFGKGNWKLILQCYRDVFQERTEVDLKDKWRNMTR